ncbi:hypothetical protein [Streptomyces lavendulocolor]|uniref:hypothetical protein n=1 Tax=Streptomyces lavendulocolor TaxID=67316 RepID=UPI003C2DB509
MDGHPVAVLPDEDGVRVIVCRGEFDLETRAPLVAADEAAMADPAVRRIILDMSNGPSPTPPGSTRGAGPTCVAAHRAPPSRRELWAPRTDASPARL